MTNLLPCPFCGGEPLCANRIYYDTEKGEIIDLPSWYVSCDGVGLNKMDCTVWVGDFPTKEQAISAWNTRAERTCHAELNEGRNAVVCSECGSSMLLEGWDKLIDWGGNEIVKTFKTYPYCPNCGARVIRDNEPVEVWQQASADDVTCYGVEE